MSSLSWLLIRFGLVRFIWLADNVERKKPYIQPVQPKKELSNRVQTRKRKYKNDEMKKKKKKGKNGRSRAVHFG